MSEKHNGAKKEKQMFDWSTKIPDEKLQNFSGTENTLFNDPVDENVRLDYQGGNTAEGAYVHRLAIQKNRGGRGSWSLKARPNEVLSRVDAKEGTSPDDIRNGLKISYMGKQRTYQGLNDGGDWVEKPDKLTKKEKTELAKENAKKESNNKNNNGKKNGRGKGKQNGEKGNGKENMKP